MSEALLINRRILNGFEKLSANVDNDKINVAISEAQDLDLRPFLGKAFFDDLIGNFSNANGASSFLLTVATTTASNGNFLNQPLVTVTGSGTGAFATFQVYGGRVQQKIVINTPGQNYNIGDTVTCAALPGAVFTISDVSIELVISGSTSQPYKDLFNGKSYTDTQGHGIIYKGIVPALAYWTLARYVEGSSFEFTSTGLVTKDHDEAKAISQKDIIVIANRMRSKANAKANDIIQFLYNNIGTYPLWRYSDRNKNARQPGAKITAIDRTDYNRAGYGGGYNGLWPYEGGLF